MKHGEFTLRPSLSGLLVLSGFLFSLLEYSKTVTNSPLALQRFGTLDRMKSWQANLP
nr:hypothetical protein [Rhodoferax sp.]